MDTLGFRVLSLEGLRVLGCAVSLGVRVCKNVFKFTGRGPGHILVIRVLGLVL